METVKIKQNNDVLRRKIKMKEIKIKVSDKASHVNVNNLNCINKTNFIAAT